MSLKVRDGRIDCVHRSSGGVTVGGEVVTVMVSVPGVVVVVKTGSGHRCWGSGS